MILYALIMHDDHDIDQSLHKKKKRFSDLPTLIFWACNWKHTYFFIWPNKSKSLVHVEFPCLRSISSVILLNIAYVVIPNMIEMVPP